MQIKTVHKFDRQEFDKEVNELLRQGWKLHGAPTFTTVGQQNQWDGGDIRSSTQSTFTQSLISEKIS